MSSGRRAAADRAAKRALDIAVAVPALVLLAPLGVVIAVAVRVESRGPVFFRQERVGRGGRVFRIHKFRSMRVDASGPSVTVGGDPRVTRVGAFLRSWKLDELPQLIDVVRGTMSLVGPRPEVPEFVALWPADARDIVLSVRPGITDPATVALRDEERLLAAATDPLEYYTTVLVPRKLRLYVAYVENRTAAGDLRLLLDTVAAVLRPAREDRAA